MGFSITLNFDLNWNRKLSLSYLQLYGSGGRSYDDEGSRRRNIRKRERDMGYNSITNTSGKSPLSKNDINTIRRSQVRN